MTFDQKNCNEQVSEDYDIQVSSSSDEVRPNAEVHLAKCN